MGINRTITAARASVKWNGEEAAVVRGLTPADVSNILVMEGENLIALIKAFDTMDTGNVDFKNTEAVADMIMGKATPLLTSLANDAPRFLAAIIAVAARDKEDDLEELTSFVEENFTLALQFECLKDIARMTFIGPEGFRLFVGNVSALASTVAGMTSASKSNKNRMIPED